MDEHGIEVEGGKGKENEFQFENDLFCSEEIVETTESDGWNSTSGKRRRIGSNAGSSISVPEVQKRAISDSKLLDDSRVILNLLKIETKDLLDSNPYKQNEHITLEMREILARWMYEVCYEEQCELGVFSLAIGCVDRFIRKVPTWKPNQFQLLGTICLLIASKMKDNNSFSLDRLAAFTDFSVTRSEILHGELSVLHSLNWDVSIITAQDFLDVILSRVSTAFSSDLTQQIRQHAQVFIDLCFISKSFVDHPPSLIASACILVAAVGLTQKSNCDHSSLSEKLKNLVECDIESLISCREQIEETLRAHSSDVRIAKRPIETPTDVTAIQVID